jgi:carboxymethylenebutenolidase
MKHKFWLRRGAALAAILLALFSSAMSGCQGTSATASETVTFNNGDLVLHGLLYRPAGSGPFPVVLFNHGSAPGMLNTQAFDAIGPVITARGWAFFAPYRRGQGLSRDVGPYIGDEMTAARAKGGMSLAAETMVRLLSTDHLSDQMAALAWLQSQSFVQPGRIAVMGNSFGGIEVVLGAEQFGYCAAVDLAGGAETWDLAPTLRDVMNRAAQNARSPMLFIQAENDFNLAPSKVLFNTMRAANRPAEIKIFPSFGTSAQDGHSFAYRGVNIWRDEATGFIERNCTR